MAADKPLPVLVEQVTQDFRSGFWQKKTRVLDRVSFEIPSQSVFGFLGANGAGKTTLIQLMVGLRRPTSGRVRISGFEAVKREAKVQIGYLPERPYFYEHLTGRRFLEFYGKLSGLEGSRLRKRIDEALAEVGMGAARDRELGKYSKGMLQRIGIAQAILHEPALLILDEPMSGLDPVGRKEIRELIVALAKEGRTIFFSSHVISDVEAICDRVALLQKGKLLGAGRLDDLLKVDSDDVEVVVAGLDKKQLKASGAGRLEVIPEGHRFRIEGGGDLNSALNAVIRARGRIISVQPVRKSLEELFE